MGLLAGIFSASDTAKRRLRGLLDDPAGTLGLGATRAVEDQAGLLGLMDQAGYTPGSNSVLLGDKKQAQKQLADKAMESFGGLLGATVWHGSPHKFDKFDSGKIGTGEGAQAYGHGLYLAENPKTAKAYLQDDGSYVFSVAGTPPPMVNGALDDATRISADSADDAFASALAALQRRSKYYAGLGMESQSKTAQHAADWMKANRASVEIGPKSSLYKVDLPDDQIAKMLDYDKPLHRQAPEVRKAVRGVVDETLGPGAYGGLIKNRPDIKDLQNNALEGLTQAQIAEALRQRGIPGIRYLDGGSRGAGQGSSNFVVFPGNEGLLSILERNGQPIK